MEKSRVENDKVRQSASKAATYSPSVQYAITKVLPNIVNGAFWGFTDMTDIRRHIDAIKAEPENLTARKLGNACLIEVNPSYMVNAIASIDNQAITKGDLDKIQQCMADAVVEFEKFLISRGKKGFCGTVGIYCTNNVTSICYKDVNYPAFRIPMDRALQFLQSYGYMIKVGTKDNASFVKPADAVANSELLWDSTHLSPTKTGVFIDIKSTFTPAQMAQCEQFFKQKYGIK